MALYAIDDLGDAWTATREFLTPFSLKRLSVLAVIVFVVGGGTSVPGASGRTGGVGGGSGEPTPGPGFGVLRGFLIENLFAIGLLVGAVLTVGLAFPLVGSVMEFVFVESLRTDEVRSGTTPAATSSRGSGCSASGWRWGS